MRKFVFGLTVSALSLIIASPALADPPVAANGVALGAELQQTEQGETTGDLRGSGTVGILFSEATLSDDDVPGSTIHYLRLQGEVRMGADLPQEGKTHRNDGFTADLRGGGGMGTDFQNAPNLYAGAELQIKGTMDGLNLPIDFKGHDATLLMRAAGEAGFLLKRGNLKPGAALMLTGVTAVQTESFETESLLVGGRLRLFGPEAGVLVAQLLTSVQGDEYYAASLEVEMPITEQVSLAGTYSAAATRRADKSLVESDSKDADRAVISHEMALKAVVAF